ncbi:MAG TPA: AIPR family protein [Longimicrobium sp.]
MELVLDDLSDAGVIEEGQPCHFSGFFGNARVKASGYGFSDEGDQIDLFVCVFQQQEHPEPLRKKEVDDAVEHAARFLRGSLEGRHTLMEPGSEAFQMATGIYDLRSSVRKVRIFVLSDGLIRVDEPGVVFEKVDSRRVAVEVHFWDIQRLFRALGSSMAHEVIEIDIETECGQAVPCLPVPSGEEGYVAYLMALPADVLYRLYDRHGSRLLELNVRSFLQARGKVNRGIRDTIRNDPGKFFPYNNGLSMTAAEVRVRRAEGRHLLTWVRGLQIVNGGQTTASIHRAKTVDRTDISRIYVQAKLTVLREADSERMVPLISQFSNTQNAVQVADFSANHDFHIELERLSLYQWVPGEQSKWFYERARGQYEVERSRQAPTIARRRIFDQQIPPSQRFTKTDLAKYLNSWGQKPHIVSRGGQKNFVAFMDTLKERYGADFVPDAAFFRAVVAQAILFKRMEQIVRTQGYSGYRANTVAYTLAYTAFRIGKDVSLEKIWDSQGVTEALDATLREWAPLVHAQIIGSAIGQNVTEWAKKEQCWERVKEIKAPSHPVL